MSSTKRSISAPAELFQRAEDRQKQLCYATFSDYIQALIRADVLKEQKTFHNTEPPAFHPRPELNERQAVSYRKAQPKKGKPV